MNKQATNLAVKVRGDVFHLERQGKDEVIQARHLHLNELRPHNMRLDSVAAGKQRQCHLEDETVRFVVVSALVLLEHI